jgi:hypothetical protein
MRLVKEKYHLPIAQMLKHNGSVSPLFQVFHMFHSDLALANTCYFNVRRIFFWSLNTKIFSRHVGRAHCGSILSSDIPLNFIDGIQS